MRKFIMLILAPVIASCTAINQKDSYLDSLPRAVAPTPPAPPSNTIFTDDFENGLGKWTQTTGTWLITTPAANGSALKSPTGTMAMNFSIITNDFIDLTTRSNCILQYEISYAVGSTGGTSAKILYGSTTIADFKQPSSTATSSSFGTFVTRRYYLPDSSKAKLTISTSVLDNTAAGSADISIDNLSVTCNNTTPTSVTLVNENFESSAANWTLSGTWARTAAIGSAGSFGMIVPWADFSLVYPATYTLNVNLQGRVGCQLRFYYNFLTNNASSFFDLQWNSNRIQSYSGAAGSPQTGYAQFSITPFEDTGTNQLVFRCNDNVGGNQTSCTVDDLTVTCQQ